MVFPWEAKKVYKVFWNDHSGHDDLSVATIGHNGLLNDRQNYWSSVVQWLFQDFLTLSVYADTQDAALASNGTCDLCAAKGCAPTRPPGSSRLPFSIHRRLRPEHVRPTVRQLGTRSSSRPT